MFRTGTSRSESGFTLLEVLVVITLLSLAALAGMVLLPDIGDRLAVAKSVAQLERVLSRVAADSIRTGHDRTAVVEKTGAMQRLDAGGEVAQLDHTVSIEWLAAAETGADSRQGVVTFFGTGGASGGKFELARGNVRAVIEVDWLTARIRSQW